MLRLFLLVFLPIVVLSFSFHLPTRIIRQNLLARRPRPTDSMEENQPAVIAVGSDIPEEIKKNRAIYDMVLVERFSVPEKTDAGLFIPIVEGKDLKHVGKVLSVPIEYGREGEQGHVVPAKLMCPYEVGDVVFIKVLHI